MAQASLHEFPRLGNRSFGQLPQRFWDEELEDAGQRRPKSDTRPPNPDLPKALNSGGFLKS